MHHEGLFDPVAFLTGRGALEVRPGGVLAVGTSTAVYDPDDMTSLLTAHLTLVRKLRRQQREAAIMLRRDDVTALAELLGESTAQVIEKLGSLMGATRSQRVTMATLFAAGALVIGLASSGAVLAHGGRGSSAVGPTSRPQLMSIEHHGSDSADFAAADRPMIFIDVESTRFGGSSALAERPAADAFDVLLELSLGDPGMAPAVETVAGTAGTVPVAPPATAPTVPTARPVHAAPASVAPPMVDTDPSLVDIGSPPIPVPPVTAPAASIPGGEVIDPPVLILEPPAEVIEQPWLAIDPPAPGFELTPG